MSESGIVRTKKAKKKSKYIAWHRIQLFLRVCVFLIARARNVQLKAVKRHYEIYNRTKLSLDFVFCSSMQFIHLSL